MKNLRWLVLCTMLIVMGLVSPLAAQIEVHGISFTKGAVSPVQVGDPYESGFVISNTVDTALDTLHVTALVDTVHASAGDVNSGNILSALTWTFNGGAQFIGVNHLELPPGSSVSSLANPFSFYTTVTGDFFLPNHVLVDTAVITWHDTCDGNSTNCNELERNSDTVSQATVTAPLPCVKVTKTVDCDVVQVGKEVTYTFTLENCGPNPLTLVDINDTVLGDLKTQAQTNCGTIDVNSSCSFTVNHTITAQDADPLVNTVVAVYIDEFDQKTSSLDQASVDVIHPDFTVVKMCTSNPIPEGGPATFDVTIHNTGDVDLSFTTNEAAQSDTQEPFTVAAGSFIDLTITKPIGGTCSDVNDAITVTANLTTTIDCPIPDIIKTSNTATCFCKPTVEVTKEADCDVATVGKLITYTINITNTGADTLTLDSVIDTLLGNITATAQANGCTTLAGGAQCSFTVTRTIQQGDPDTLDNMVTVVYKNSQDVNATDDAMASVAVIHPNFTVTKTCTSEPIPSGGPATFNVAIQNTGDVVLSFTTSEAAQSSLAEPFTVAVGITQNLTITIPTSGTSDVVNTITVTGEPNDNDQFKCPVAPIQKTAQDTCHGAGAATRTWGFWKTHTTFTKCVFDKCGSSFDLGWRQVTTYAQLFGIFEANNAKNSDGSTRTDLCKAQVTASHQALAALLNTCLDNGKPLPAGITPCSIANTLKCGTAAEVKALNSILDAYNNSGDTVKLAPTEPCVQGSATPAASKAAANIPFADTKGGTDCTNSSNCPACP